MIAPKHGRASAAGAPSTGNCMMAVPAACPEAVMDDDPTVNEDMAASKINHRKCRFCIAIFAASTGGRR
jgi:hypothetical protein